nr:MAG TPA: hypothetical protein [Caudoviricetes sp.]
MTNLLLFAIIEVDLERIRTFRKLIEKKFLSVVEIKNLFSQYFKLVSRYHRRMTEQRTVILFI